MFKYFESKFKPFERELLSFPWQDKYAYALFLTQVYHFVKHSSRIMSVVASKFSQERETVHRNLLKHMNEEAGHQFLAKKDIEHLGFRLEELPELYSTRQFYEPQYYKALYNDPIGFYGYALALEGSAVKLGTEIYKKTRDLHGEKAALFWKVHAGDDVDHVGEALKMLETLSEPEKNEIKDNLSQSIYGLVKMFIEIKECAAETRKTA